MNRRLSLLVIGLFVATLAVAPAPAVSAEPSPCDLSGVWTKRYDEKVDGAVAGTVTENALQISGPAGRQTAKYVGATASNKSRFTVTCEPGKTTLITIAQQDNAYRSVIVASRTASGAFVGTWYDNSGNAGDLTMEPEGR